MFSSIHSICQIAESLGADSPAEDLMATLKYCVDDLSASSELLEFFEEVATCIGVKLTVFKNEVEIATISLSPIHQVCSLSRIEPGLYEVFVGGRLVWHKELVEADLLVDSELPLAASDEEIEPRASLEVFLSGFSVWLSVIPGVESGSLKFKLE